MNSPVNSRKGIHQNFLRELSNIHVQFNNNIESGSQESLCLITKSDFF